MSKKQDSFFVGYLSAPKPLRLPLLMIATLFVSGFIGTGWLLVSTLDNGGGGGFRFDWGQQTVTGVIEVSPYPILHVVESERLSEGHTLLLSGQGKRGVADRALAFDGQTVTVNGFGLQRGDINMLQVNGGAGAIQVLTEREVIPPVPESLGHWRITGEICDGKCAAGAMRPGTGLAHRACANLCLIGGAPPLLVTATPVDGQTFFLLADASGAPVSDLVMEYTAIPVEMEGELVRRGGLLEYRIDPSTLQEVSP